jgi:hypothetical protein
MFKTETKGKENYDPPPTKSIYDLLKMSDSTGHLPTSGNINLPTTIVHYVLATTQSIQQ